MDKFKKATVWSELFKNQSSEFYNYLSSIYGDDPDLIERKTAKYTEVLSSFINKYGDEDVIIARAPGRVNLMGRHIEHRGGDINTIAIHKETIMVASLRQDDKICISNTNPEFTDFCFSVSEEKNLCDEPDWLDYIENSKVTDTVAKNKGHWVNYVKGSVLRLLFDTNKVFHGMNIMCLGTVPVAGGVSSSSSIVTCTAELVCYANNIEIEQSKFIDLCGQSEWYVGSRGGAGDHAAIKCGVLNSITPIEFAPIKVLDSIKIPDGYSIIVADSFIKAKKSEGAKDKFNQMVAAYEFGVMLIKKNYPEYSDKIVYLRDINPKTLGVSEKKIYEMVLSLPLYIKPSELYEQISEEYHKKIEKITKSHVAPEFYNLRSTILYGICECERGRICSKLLKSGNIEEFASIMNISHDGDRVAITVDGEQKPFDYIYTDERIKELIEKCDNNDDTSALYLQGGGYGCSIPEIDALVDSVLKEKGVLSSQISGAGLGGCIMIICKKECETDVLQFLKENYYIPNNLSIDGALLVKPIKGSMCLEF